MDISLTQGNQLHLKDHFARKFYVLNRIILLIMTTPLSQLFPLGSERNQMSYWAVLQLSEGSHQASMFLS